MLTDKFWKLAAKNKAWKSPEYDSPYDDWYGAGIFCIRPSSTHCGTSELQNLGVVSQQHIATEICHQVVNNKEGHLLYFCPVGKKYRGGTKKLEALGFQKIYNFHHLGYLNRAPDYGVAELWSLSISPADFDELLKL